MTTRARWRHLLLAALAAITTALAVLTGATTATATTPPTAENSVRAITPILRSFVGTHETASPSQRPIHRAPQPRIVAATGATKAAGAAADDWPVSSGIVRDAAKGKGNFGIGSGTVAQAETAGRAWVGDGARLASDGMTWPSQDGLRQWRPPSYKPRLDKWQSNFEARWELSGQWQTNGHLDIVGAP